MSAPKQVKVYTQYTTLGIRRGEYDDDLEALLKVIQSRRAKIGRLQIVRKVEGADGATYVADAPMTDAGGNGEYPKNPNAGASGVVFTENHFIPTVEADSFLTWARDRHTHLHGVLISQTNRSPGTVEVDGHFFPKDRFTNRVFTIHPSRWREEGYRFVHVKSVSRRNLTGIPFGLVPSVSIKRANLVRKMGEVTWAPEVFLDFYRGGIDAVNAVYNFTDSEGWMSADDAVQMGNVFS